MEKKDLFKELYLYDNWDWEKKYPVVYISFGMGTHQTPEKLRQNIAFQLKLNKQNLDIDCENNNSFSACFTELILKAYDKYSSPIVVLVDEYDKPILDAIENFEMAKENREILKDFYSPLKDLDPYLKLVFLTGVSRFSKVSIFSGLNQIYDITLDPQFATICGYTQSELENIFHDRLKDFDKEEVKKWYNGYSWLGEAVYNPFDVLLLFANKMFRPYWFETGTPSFLIKMIEKERFYIPKLEQIEVGSEILESIDVENMPLESLLFQTGYLTIKNMERIGPKYFYSLSYPNLEVRMSFNDSFLDYVIKRSSFKERISINLLHAFIKGDLDNLKETIQSFFSSIPYHWYTKNDLDKYQGFYASIIYALFNGAGIIAIPEDTTSKGRIDLTAFMENKIYIIEFKVVDKPSEDPLKQIKEKKYYEKYLSEDKEIYIVGIEFLEEQRNIINFGWERIR
ncbi:AAA family ATPase [Hydrogenobaculum sp.]